MKPFFDRSAAWHAGVGAAALAILVLILAVGFVRKARAEWKPEYAQASPSVQDWYRNAELTPEAQKRFGFKSCCNHSDVVKTRFRLIGRDDGWEFVDAQGQWQRVPHDIIHTDPAPGGEPVMFAVGGRPTCFFPPLGGG